MRGLKLGSMKLPSVRRKRYVVSYLTWVIYEVKKKKKTPQQSDPEEET